MKVKEIRKVIPALAVVIVIAGVFAYWLYREDVTHHGRAFSSRNKMCYQFAIDYLKNIKNDPNYTDEKRALAIDIETEITKLCQLELTEEAAGDYTPTALEKYKNETAE